MGDKRKTTRQFIQEAKQIHGEKYDYSKVNYITNREKVCIICPQHGEFWKTPSKHLQGQGCPCCVKRKRKSTEDFIREAQTIHGTIYDYSQVEYINSETKIKITCKKHGEFWMTPSHHLRGQGCPVCRYIKSAKGRRRTLEEVVRLATTTHKGKYNYILMTEYKNDRIKYPIICPIHGEFYQNMNNHIHFKEGCPLCAIEKNAEMRTYTKEEFIAKANETHNFRYNYSKVEYVNSHTKVCIICPIHGEFWQIPRNHIHGQGCPICKESKLEKNMEKILRENSIIFEREATFEWLRCKRYLYLDFYLPEYNIAIECQGKQHFIDDGFGDFELIKERDRIKKELCEKNGIQLLYYSDLEINFPYEVLTDEREVITKIITR